MNTKNNVVYSTQCRKLSTCALLGLGLYFCANSKLSLFILWSVLDCPWIIYFIYVFIYFPMSSLQSERIYAIFKFMLCTFNEQIFYVR